MEELDSPQQQLFTFPSHNPTLSMSDSTIMTAPLPSVTWPFSHILTGLANLMTHSICATQIAPPDYFNGLTKASTFTQF